MPFSYLDLAALPPVAQRAAIEAMAGELQGSLSLSHGPLLRVALFDLGADHPCRLLIIMHHLAGDVASLHIVLEDFYTAYQQLDRGESIVLPPKTASFKAWAGRLLAHAQTSAIKQELSYWLALPWHTVAPLPVDYPAERSANTDLSADWVNVLLDRATTQVLLQDVLAQYDAQITDVLLTALALTFASWTNMPALLVEIVVHGRTISGRRGLVAHCGLDGGGHLRDPRSRRGDHARRGVSDNQSVPAPDPGQLRPAALLM